MGALRASELDTSGMIGVGWVYNHFRSCSVRRDDDVAIVYSPLDFKSMTIPMVDIEYWMELVSAARLINSAERTRLLRVARTIFFADRDLDTLMDAFRRTLGMRNLTSFLECVGGTIPNVKYMDALAAFRFAIELGSSPPDKHARKRPWCQG
jgi:TfuA protein